MVKKSRAPSQPKTVRDDSWLVIVAGACVLAAFVLCSGMFISDLTQRLVRAERRVLLMQDQTTYCQRDIKGCRQMLDDSKQMTLDSSPLRYVLEGDVELVRESDIDGSQQALWLVKAGQGSEAATSVKKLIGRFDIVQGLGGKAFSIKRLPNGLYEFVATSDVVEGGTETVGYIDPATMKFLTFTQGTTLGNDFVIGTPTISQGRVIPHVLTNLCASSSSRVVVDVLHWNSASELLYAFRRPPTVACRVNELAGTNDFALFSTRSVARDLNSFVVTLSSGSKLRFDLNGANTPTVSVTQ